MGDTKYTTRQHREWVIKALTEVQTDIIHIKESTSRNEKWLNKINGRTAKTEGKINFIQGVGSVVAVVFGSLITWLFKSHRG